MPFDRKLLFGFQSLPGQVARFGKGPNLARRRGKLGNPRREASFEELRE
jgi:hypothetical protein